MSPLAVVLFLSVVLAPASMAAPVPSSVSPVTVHSTSALTAISTSTSTAASDVPPPPVFTFGPSGLPYPSAPSAPSASASTPVLEMDWLS